MRIHTDNLMSGDLMNLAEVVGLRVTSLDTHGSRSHNTRYDIILGGSHTSRQQGGADFAATYREWGLFLKHVFTHDPGAKAGPYNGVHDFIEKTHGEFTPANV